MFCFWRTSDLVVLLTWTVFMAESSCSRVKDEMKGNVSSPLAEATTTVFAQMRKNALLCCRPISLTNAMLIEWVITPRGQPTCRISYRVETKETNRTNCTDNRISWASTPDQHPDLQINAVALEHDGHYTCEIATPDGYFQERNELQVLVPPEVALFPGENGTAVCEAIVGKPAAQIFWTPDGHCVSKNESHSNGTVTVRSTCRWEQNNVSTVSCFVSHLTGNQTHSIELKSGGGNTSGFHLPFIIPSIIIVAVLIIIGWIWLLKISGFRKCKLIKPEATPVVEEDEMQPYASYTEKSNPLYDTVTKAEMFPVSQGEVDGTSWLT